MTLLIGSVSDGAVRCGDALTAVPTADLAVAEHDALERGEALEPDRAARVQLVGGDADLGAQAVLEAVGEAGRGVHHHRARIDLAQEAPRARDVLGDDRVGVLRAVGARCARSPASSPSTTRTDEDRREVLGVPVFLGRGLHLAARARALPRRRAARRPCRGRSRASGGSTLRRDVARAPAASPSCCRCRSAASWRCRRCGSPCRDRRVSSM